MSESRIDSFINEARSILGNKLVMTDAVRRLAWGTDAGFYRHIPKVVLKPANEKQVSQLLELASRLNVTVTFRAAGTSLSGQAVSDEVIMLAGKDWEDYSINTPDASIVTFQPGITGARANQILLPYGRKFSPDPASVASAMIGGIVANNASGMNCGTHANSYRVLLDARLILADGTILDTGDEQSRANFAKSHAHIVDAIAALRDEIRNNSALSKRITDKYSIKNVVGLNLLPFIEIDNPIDIISHLLVGSEGTLAFISSVTVKTEKIKPLSASAMLYFESIREACIAVQKLKPLPVVSAELLDSMSLRAVSDPSGEKGHTSLLVETRADNGDELQDNITKIKEALKEFNLVKEVNFATDPDINAGYWKLRSGVFPAVGATRPKGKTVLIEDVAFHLDDLPQATMDLLDLLKKHSYDDACIYGHVLEGNYHFIISQSFDTEEEVTRYQNLMDDVEKLVVDKYDGSLKAEHGTGRNMAPFVELEWGTEAWNAMKRVKNIFDPKNILNRGVIFNDDKLCHIHNLKPLPAVNDIIDKCIECGFCEINCVSCGLGLSSRQRIVIAREITRLEQTGENPELLKELKEGFRYLGDELCAGDGLCSTSCPVKINTGDYIHYVREQRLPRHSIGYKTGKAAAKHLAGVSTILRPLLSTAGVARRVMGAATTDSLGKALHHIGLPLWTASLPTANYFHASNSAEKSPLKAVYLPSCINRAMGGSIEKNRHKEKALTRVMESLMTKAGFEVIYPEGLTELCCGMIWESKGMPDLAQEKLEETRAALMKASQGGKYPIVCDQSPCLHRLREHIKDLKLYEPAEFIFDFLVPNLDFVPEKGKVALHLTCSTRQMPGVADKLIKLAKMCVAEVLVPEQVGCCGFAGDKGFTVPELNRYGLRHLKPQLLNYGIKEGFSNSRTCEIGLSTNGDIPYKSIAYLVDRVTKPKPIQK